LSVTHIIIEEPSGKLFWSSKLCHENEIISLVFTEATTPVLDEHTTSIDDSENLNQPSKVPSQDIQSTKLDKEISSIH